MKTYDGALGRIKHTLEVETIVPGYNDKVSAAKELLELSKEGLKQGKLNQNDIDFVVKYLRTAERLSAVNKTAELAEQERKCQLREKHRKLNQKN